MKYLVFSLFLAIVSCGGYSADSNLNQVIDEKSLENPSLFGVYQLLHKHISLGIEMSEVRLQGKYFVTSNQKVFDGTFYIISESGVTKIKVKYDNSNLIDSGQSLLGYMFELEGSKVALKYHKSRNFYELTKPIDYGTRAQKIKHSPIKSVQVLGEADKKTFMKNLVRVMIQKIELPTKITDISKTVIENKDAYKKVKRDFSTDMVKVIDLLPEDLFKVFTERFEFLTK